MPITTKWPRLLVTGQPVTETQADEILIRTNQWRLLFGNDHDWVAAVEQVASEFGRPTEPQRGPDHDAYLAELRNHRPVMEAWLERAGILQLSYLGNDRVMSSWIGGPHGWCDWDGRIGCSTFNIGKWPSDDQVTGDWEAVAEAFPYLDLTAQCVDEEGEGQVAAQWRVVGGTVEYDPQPTEQIRSADELDEEQVVGHVLGIGFGSERGVSVDRLRQALGRVAAVAR